VLRLATTLVTWLVLSLGTGAAGAQDESDAPALPVDGAALTSRAAALADELEARAGTAEVRGGEIARLAEMVEQMMAILGDSRSTSSARQQIIAGLYAELATARAARDGAESDLSTTQAERDELARVLAAARSNETRMHEQEVTLHAQLDELDLREARIAELTASLAAEKVVRDELAALRGEHNALRLNAANQASALQATRAEATLKTAKIDDLERALSSALAREVKDLERYRSEFFGKLRQVIGERRDVRVVGDRFVFQSEVLFDTGSAELGPEGPVQLGKLAATLLEVAATIPDEIPWVLRIDGHTDRRPISTESFPSNWELSSDRAISVVRFLIENGIAAKRLVAAGFAEHQPLDRRDDEIAYRRNRRIEIKLTQR
jgi:chemotaxis protein MotB